MIKVIYSRLGKRRYAVIDTASNKYLFRAENQSDCERYIDSMENLFYLSSSHPWSNYASLATPWVQTS
jgi:hypothetical protein